MDIFNIIMLSANIIGALLNKNIHSILGWSLSLVLYLLHVLQKGM